VPDRRTAGRVRAQPRRNRLPPVRHLQDGL
jgi:hypothetical protein